jgi:hypothetical protein
VSILIKLKKEVAATEELIRVRSPFPTPFEDQEHS